MGYVTTFGCLRVVLLPDDESALLDLDAEGNVCGITVEHARDRVQIPQFSFEQIAA